MLECSVHLRVVAVRKVCQPPRSLPVVDYYGLSSQGHHCANTRRPRDAPDGAGSCRDAAEAHLGPGGNGWALPKPCLGLTAAGRAVPKRGDLQPSPPHGSRRKGTREGGHGQSAGSPRCCGDSWVRFSCVLLQLQPDVGFFFLIKWKLSTKTFCPRGIQILNVLLITVCKTFRKIYGNTFTEKKSDYSCLKMLFWHLNFMNHPVWPNC